MNFDVHEAWWPFFFLMCLFSFEPANCALSRANGWQVSKSLRSICNSEWSDSLRAPQLTNSRGSPALTPHLSRFCFESWSARIYTPRDVPPEKREYTGRLVFGSDLVFQLHSSSPAHKVRDIKQEGERNQLSSMFPGFPQVQIQQTRHHIKVKLFTHYMTCPFFSLPRSSTVQKYYFRSKAVNVIHNRISNTS